MALFAQIFEASPDLSSIYILASFGILAVACGLLFASGVLSIALGFVSYVLRSAVHAGFRFWRMTVAWANAFVFFVLVVGAIVLGLYAVETLPALAVLLGTGTMILGMSASLAYVYLDKEQVEVERGYKALHSPLKGQRLAADLARYGHRATFFLLIGAAVGVLGGFALLNLGLYRSIGRNWYRLDHATANFPDFLVFGILNIYRLVDLLDVANKERLVRLSHITATALPATLLLSGFKSFVMFVLLERIFAALRQGRLLAETIEDFFSPHQPIHDRARYALPHYGIRALRPLLASLQNTKLTPEQRKEMPQIVAEIGPDTVPWLLNGLRDPDETIRLLAVATLGELGALEALPALLGLKAEATEHLRRARIEALGQIYWSEDHTRPIATRRASSSWLRRWWRSRHMVSTPDAKSQIIGALTFALEDPAPSVRLAALEDLEKIGPPAKSAVSSLLPLFTDLEDEVRCHTARAFGRIGAKDVDLSGLIRLLKDPSPQVRAAAAEALGKLGAASATSLPELVELLQDRDEEVRNQAAAALGKAESLDHEMTGDLAEGLSSPDALVRARVAEAIGNIGPAAENIAPALAKALKDSNDRVRAKAVKALGKIGKGAAAAAVAPLLAALSDPDTWVRALAAEALGEMGDAAKQAVPALIRSLSHANIQVRYHGVEALGKLGESALASLPALQKTCLDDDPGVRAQAATALAELAPQQPATLTRLGLALRDEVAEVRIAAAKALRKCKPDDKEIRAGLLHALGDASDDVKMEAAHALAACSGSDAQLVAYLTKLLEEDDNGWVRAESASLLGRLGDEAVPAGPALVRAAQTQEVTVREAALRALVLIQPPEAPAAFLAALQEDHPDLRMIASAAWHNATVVPPEAAPGLLEALNDPESQVRANVAFAIGRLNPLPEEALAPLMAGLHDSSPEVRLNCVLALQSAPPSRALAAELEPFLEDEQPRLRLLAAGPILRHYPEHELAQTAVRQGLVNPRHALRQAAAGIIAGMGAAGLAFFADIEQQEKEEDHPEILRALQHLLRTLTELQEPKPEAPADSAA